ncbi:MAG TPA: hypothetical protein V6D00_06580 [Pantanalinema sp.]
MQQPPKGSPQRGTQPLRQGTTRPFSDTFVPSGGPAAPAQQRGTRPLQPLSPDALKTLVPQRLTEVQKDLDYVRHLTTLFSTPVTLLRYAAHLVDAPPAPEAPAAVEETGPSGEETPLDQPEEGEAAPLEPEDPTPVPFRGLTTAQRALAHDVAEVLKRDPKLKQRAMVALFQFDDTHRNYREAAELMDEIYGCDFAAAWERLPLLGIERLKGKAYAICGFYENFKHDPVINRVFPAPSNGGGGATGPLNAPGGRTGPLVQPVVQPVSQPVTDTSLTPSGLLGKIKGLFGK